MPANREFTEAVSELAKHQSDKMKKLADEADRTYDETRKLVITITAGALLAALIATLITCPSPARCARPWPWPTAWPPAT
jgi:hypothetical protein